MNDILVVGAGITGATVANRLSSSGIRVLLIDRNPTIGGHAVEMGCKATDTCLRCNVCTAHEMLKATAESPDIRVRTGTELIKLSGNGNGSRYTAFLKHAPTYIDGERCTSCLACVSACPKKCISLPEYSVSPPVPVLDYATCLRAKGKECSECVQACSFDAISFKEKESRSEIQVDNVVIATGYEPYNPAENASYGYGQMENIITGREAEQQLAKHQSILRPSDGEAPKRVAFIQCVGSRSEEAHRRPEDTNYCSTVCCSYALRIAQLMQHQTESEITIFYMDIQNFGKGFDDFFKKCNQSMTFVRSRPYEMRQGTGGAVRVKYASPSFSEKAESQVCEEEFDLVVLAVGIRPDPTATELAERLLAPVDEYGFFGIKGAAPLADMQRRGIFAAGACESPKDIQSSMAQADAVSAMILSKGG